MSLRLFLIVVLALLSSLLFSDQTTAQNKVFTSSEIRTIAQLYCGTPQAWPFVVELATYKADNNSFELSVEQQGKLRNLKNQFQLIESIKQNYSDAIKNGAKVFAIQELIEYDNAFIDFSESVKNGNFERFQTSTQVLQERIEQLKTAINTRRIEHVAAVLAEKTGSVDQRKGLLGSWKPSNEGDLYKEADGIKTGKASLAKLDFVDGSYVVVDPLTIAQVRASSIDKLTQVAQTEIEIETGSLITAVSTETKQKSGILVKSDASETRVNSSKFWISKDKQEVLRLSNYDGNALVKTEAGNVELQKDEGTLIERGKNPLPAIKLLQAPKLTWPGSDSISYDADVTLHWSDVALAAYYEIDISPSSTFTYDVTTYRAGKTPKNIRIENNGTYYIRLRGFDKQNLRGIDSPVYRLLKTKDTQPPAVFITNGKENTYYTYSTPFELRGITEPNAELNWGSSKKKIKKDGNFSLSLDLTKEINSVEFHVSDASGNTTTISKTVVFMQESRLYDITWSVKTEGNKVHRAEKIMLSAKAYPGLQVLISINEKEVKVLCGHNGDWSLQLNPENAEAFSITYLDQSGKSLAKKLFEFF